MAGRHHGFADKPPVAMSCTPTLFPCRPTPAPRRRRVEPHADSRLGVAGRPGSGGLPHRRRPPAGLQPPSAAASRRDLLAGGRRRQHERNLAQRRSHHRNRRQRRYSAAAGRRRSRGAAEPQVPVPAGQPRSAPPSAPPLRAGTTAGAVLPAAGGFHRLESVGVSRRHSGGPAGTSGGPVLTGVHRVGGRTTLRIGRDPSNDLVLSDLLASRRHAEFTRPAQLAPRSSTSPAPTARTSTAAASRAGSRSPRATSSVSVVISYGLPAPSSSSTKTPAT